MQFINSMLKTLDVDILITFGVVLLMISWAFSVDKSLDKLSKNSCAKICNLSVTSGISNRGCIYK